MSRSGQRVTPASGGTSDAPQESATAEPGVRRGLPAVRWWPRSFRAGPRPGPAVDDGRWGVARLVAEREARQRASEVENAEDAAAVDVVEEPGDGAGDVGTDAAEPQVVALPDVESREVVSEESELQDADTEDRDAERHAAEDRVAERQTAGDPAAAEDAVEERVVEDAAADGADPRDPPSPPAPREPERVIPPSPRRPLRTRPLVPRPPLPSPRRPHTATHGPVVPNATDSRAARPRVEPDPSLFGFARHTRGRLGGRVFTLFFLLVFAFIAVQTIASLV